MNIRLMLSTRTAFSGYSVAFSPYRANVLAVATSQYYGIAGNGRVLVLDLDRGMSVLAEFGTKDGCFDVSWSEKNDQVLAVATGDGSVKIFATSQPGTRPLVNLTGHSAETYSVDWNVGVHNEWLCSASWDQTVRIWDVAVGQSIGAPLAHPNSIVYEARWGNGLIGTVGGDGFFRVWDVLQKNKVLALSHGQGEVLCMDWNKYNSNIVATGGVDRAVKIWDLRRPAAPLNVFADHLLAVRRVRFDPSSRESGIASCSYDMTVKLSDSCGSTFDHHSEFVVGLAWSPLRPGLLASTSWDRTVAVWTPSKTARHKF